MITCFPSLIGCVRGIQMDDCVVCFLPFSSHVGILFCVWNGVRDRNGQASPLSFIRTNDLSWTHNRFLAAVPRVATGTKKISKLPYCCCWGKSVKAFITSIKGAEGERKDGIQKKKKREKNRIATREVFTGGQHLFLSITGSSRASETQWGRSWMWENWLDITFATAGLGKQLFVHLGFTSRN